MNDECGLSKMKVEFQSDLNESVNLLDFGFVKNCRIPTTFKFGFKLHHNPI